MLKTLSLAWARVSLRCVFLTGRVCRWRSSYVLKHIANLGECRCGVCACVCVLTCECVDGGAIMFKGECRCGVCASVFLTASASMAEPLRLKTERLTWASVAAVCGVRVCSYLRVCRWRSRYV